MATTVLLTSLRDRGMRTDRSVLVVLDRANALRAAVREVFGYRPATQHCQVHKMRNVLEHLQKKQREFVRAALRRA